MPRENVSNASKSIPKEGLPSGVTKGTPNPKGAASKADNWEGASLPEGVTRSAPSAPWNKA